jgi:hypothetical protein
LRNKTSLSGTLVPVELAKASYVCGCVNSSSQLVKRVERLSKIAKVTMASEAWVDCTSIRTTYSQIRTAKLEIGLRRHI